MPPLMALSGEFKSERQRLQDMTFRKLCREKRRQRKKKRSLSFHFLMGWEDLGTVETIYEEDYEFSSSSPSLSPSDLFSSPPTPLHSRVEQWSRGSGIKPDVIIRVQGKCFHLHKDALSSKSNYLRRHLMAASAEFTLSPPLNVTAETFALVAGFCYGAHILLTPFNVAALRTAAELLEMKEGDGDGKDSFAHLTEYYFRGVIGVNREYTLVVFRSCLELLPAAEKTAFMVSRCVEAYWSGKDKEDGDISCFEDVKSVEVEGFLVVAESMSRRFDSHDMLYNLVNLYLTGNGGKVTEEEKSQVCSFIDCSKLSLTSLLEAVQNPIMPLRFIVQALLVEQLNTRISLHSTKGNGGPPQRRRSSCKDPLTLGAILHRDATMREEAKMKATVDATSSRIRSLEKELSGMKKLLTESDCRQRSILESARSSSFHYGTENKLRKGERGSISSSMFRSGIRETDRKTGEESSFPDSGRHRPFDGTPRLAKSMATRVMNGIKSAFRGSSSGPKRGTETKSKVSSFRWDGNGGEDDGEEDDAIAAIREKKKVQFRAEVF